MPSSFNAPLSPDRLVLVTGAGGFIGGHMVDRLRRDGYGQVRAVDRKPLAEWDQCLDGVENLVLDLTHLDNCQKATEGASVVFNLAAEMGGMGYIENNKAACSLSVLGNTHMLVAARDHEVERFFFSSSACVYAAGKQSSPDVAPLKEDDAYPAMPEDGYGWEKLFTERMARHFYEDFGLETRVARYHNVYGPLGTYDGGREKAPAAICRKVATAVLARTDEIEIWGDGEQTRSFMFVDDCVDGTLRLAASECRQPINVGSSELVTINELVTMCEAIAGVQLRRRYKLDAPQGVRGRNSDNTLVRAELGWEPLTPLQQGLETTYRWVFQQLRDRGVGGGAGSAS